MVCITPFRDQFGGACTWVGSTYVWEWPGGGLHIPTKWWLSALLPRLPCCCLIEELHGALRLDVWHMHTPTSIVPTRWATVGIVWICFVVHVTIGWGVKVHCSHHALMETVAEIPGADLKGVPWCAPLLFSQWQRRAPLICAETGRLTVCGHPDPAAFFLKKCFTPSICKFLDLLPEVGDWFMSYDWRTRNCKSGWKHQKRFKFSIWGISWVQPNFGK